MAVCGEIEWDFLVQCHQRSEGKAKAGIWQSAGGGKLRKGETWGKQSREEAEENWGRKQRGRQVETN